MRQRILSGIWPLRHGAYDQYFTGKLEDHAYPQRKMAEALTALIRVGNA